MNTRKALYAFFCITIQTMVLQMTVFSTLSASADHVLEEYRDMMNWQYDKTEMAIPAGGVTVKRDCAKWMLESGSFQLMKPASDGRITGMYFKGQGRFVMEFPDPLERRQFERFSGKKVSWNLDETFDEMVLRTSERLLKDLFPISAEKEYDSISKATECQERWLKLLKTDIDARIATGMIETNDEFLCMDMRTKQFGWLTFLFDALQMEEIQLIKLQEKQDFIEVWVSLDRAEHRDPERGPSAIRVDVIDIEHADINVDLSRGSWRFSGREWDEAEDTAFFQTFLHFKPLMPGRRSLILSLNSEAEVKSVRTEEGKELPFIRDRIGMRFASVNINIYDRSLYVILDRPLTLNETQSIKIRYEMDIPNYVSGRDWYPGTSEGINDLHTVKLEVSYPKKYDLAAVGKLIEKSKKKKTRTAVWKTSVPTKMFGFSFGKGFKKEKVNLEGVPEVTAIGLARGLTTGNMVRNVAIDVAKSLAFYQWFFDMKLPEKTLYAAQISGYHGQAFHGFQHLSTFTFQSEAPGESELFRAHETAHQFWGHQVGFETYRDQWLSEAFAEYSAMLYLQTTMKEKKYFYKILEVYNNELTGSIKSTMSKFARPWNSFLSKEQRRQIGPIGVGYRASTADAPNGYFLQTYQKGALVIHMLRVLLNDDLFRRILQDFLHTYKGKNADTDDFIETVEKNTGEDWNWFFDQWIYGTAIPTYDWECKLPEAPGADGSYEIEISVHQSDVPDDFTMKVPVLIGMVDDSIEKIFLTIDRHEQTYTHKVSRKPTQISFNPNNAVLAKVKQK